MKWLLLPIALFCACGPKVGIHDAAPSPEVRFRPASSNAPEGSEWLLAGLENAQWDLGLEESTRLLVQASPDRLARISPSAANKALAKAGYPGHARFFLELTGGAPPEQLRQELQAAAGQRSQPADLALAKRTFGDGTVLWIGAIAHRPVLLDPIPQQISLDARVPIGVEVLNPHSADPLARLPKPVLFITPPFGSVRAIPLHTERTRWVEGFTEPGRYQMEVVARGDRATQVVLKWSLFVDSEPPSPERLKRGSLENPNPIEATRLLYEALNQIRAEAGLSSVERFMPFEPLAREHAAFMAITGIVDHQVPGYSKGVSAQAEKRFHPGARHYENLAVAPSWSEAMDMVRLSPGHLANLFCEECTHASIGVALEPVRTRVPRLFVVWELLEFPHGPPQPTQHE